MYMKVYYLTNISFKYNKKLAYSILHLHSTLVYQKRFTMPDSAQKSSPASEEQVMTSKTWELRYTETIRVQYLLKKITNCVYFLQILGIL